MTTTQKQSDYKVEQSSFKLILTRNKELPFKLDPFLSTINRCSLGEDCSTYRVFASCGILMPKYVISGLLIYFIQYVLSCLNKHYRVQSNKYFNLLSSQLVYGNKVVKVVNANRFPEKRHLLPDKPLEIFNGFY